jgi:phosphoribosylglycinamide formyltransferase 1
MEGRIAVLASGKGTNLQALLDDPRVGPHVALVVSDRVDAPALDRARAHEIETVHLDPRDFPTRAAHDEALATLLRDRATDVVVLAGYMRILGPEVVEAFSGQMLNVHPSLLPAFPGIRAIAEAVDYGVRVTGVTVHLVDEQLDHGPVVFQEAVEVHPDDTAESLEERVHEVEHRLLPAAVEALLEGRIHEEGHEGGRSVRVEERTS